MSNLLRIQNKSKLIETKSKQVLLKIKEQYDRGEIHTEVEYLYKMYQALQSMFNAIDQPTMKVRLAAGPPSSTDYNNMLSETYADLQLLFTETNEVGLALQQSFHQIEIDRQSLNNRLKKIEDNLTEIQAKASQNPQEITYRDSFIGQQYFDRDMINESAANLSTQEGILTLKPISSENYLTGATLRILEGNGLPGNTHQVRSVGGVIQFAGEDNLHLNLAEILDGNADTWFEYEIFEVPNVEIERCAGIGFEHHEGVKWILEGQHSLRIVFEIELPFMKTINWFSLNPFIPSDKGARPAMIKSVKIYDGKGKVTEVANKDELFSEEKVFMFSPEKCKRIVVSLEQETAYETTIGHLFYKQLEESNTNFLDRNQEKSGKRIPGIYPSIENLGMKYDAANQTVIQPSAAEGSTLSETERRKQNLFLLPETTDRVQVGFDQLSGWRYVIGLRDAGVSNYRFESISEYVSINFTSESPLYGVSLSVNATIPKEFEDGTWLQYYISIDDGQNWHSIVPRGTITQGSSAKTMYLFNSNTPPEGRIPYFGYVDQLESVHQIRLKILLSRPSSILGQAAEYYTPILHEYKLHAITSGEDS